MNELDFLKAYKELCLKHGYEIAGCGDCGSAWLSKLKEQELKHKTLTWEKDFTCIQFATDYEIKDEQLEKL